MKSCNEENAESIFVSNRSSARRGSLFGALRPSADAPSLVVVPVSLSPSWSGGLSGSAAGARSSSSNSPPRSSTRSTASRRTDRSSASDARANVNRIVARRSSPLAPDEALRRDSTSAFQTLENGLVGTLRLEKLPVHAVQNAVLQRRRRVAGGRTLRLRAGPGPGGRLPPPVLPEVPAILRVIVEGEQQIFVRGPMQGGVYAAPNVGALQELLPPAAAQVERPLQLLQSAQTAGEAVPQSALPCFVSHVQSVSGRLYTVCPVGTRIARVAAGLPATSHPPRPTHPHRARGRWTARGRRREACSQRATMLPGDGP